MYNKPKNFFWIFIYLIFGCTASLLLHRGFSSCGKQRLLSSCGARASHCSGFSCCGAQALGHKGSALVVYRLSCSWNVASSWTRDRTLSSAVSGRFFTTEPPGKLQRIILTLYVGDSISLLSVHKLNCYFLSQQLLKWSSQKKDTLIFCL